MLQLDGPRRHATMSFAYALATLAPIFLQMMPTIMPQDFRSMSKEDALVFLLIVLVGCGIFYCFYRMIVCVPETLLKITAMFVIAMFVVGLCITPTENRCTRFSDGVVRTLKDLLGWAWSSWPKIVEIVRTNFNGTNDTSVDY